MPRATDEPAARPGGHPGDRPGGVTSPGDAEPGYVFEYGVYGETRSIAVRDRGDRVLVNNFLNRGTAFDDDDRHALGFTGSLPPTVRTLDQQVSNALRKVDRKDSDLERFVFLRSLFDRNVVLAHRVIRSDIERLMGVIYTPTVGLACQQYSSMFRGANGLHFFPGNIDRAEEILARYRHRGIRVAVVTDNQGILGIGDQGAGGIAICLGKLMLYTQAAGIAPWHCLPISLDVGTDNEALLDDPHYLGWRQRRLSGTSYTAFIERFARAFHRVFPHALCQWEDFSKQNAFEIRDAHLQEMISFNDDIQGTGAVALAAVLTAMKIKRERLADQVFLVHGAGAGGVGIAEQLAVALEAEGLTTEQALDRILTVDSRGLVTTDRDVEPYKRKFARSAARCPWYAEYAADPGLESIVRLAGVTVLIGTSGQAGCFNRDVVEAVGANTGRPVILPLSNPTDSSEARPADIEAWTAGRALVATGSPFAPVERDGRGVRVGQCNNVFVFPGVGAGVLASGASEVLPSFFTAAAHAVSDAVSVHDREQGILMPSVSQLRSVSDRVALAVGRDAILRGVSQRCAFAEFRHRNAPERLEKLIRGMRWEPAYVPLVPA